MRTVPRYDVETDDAGRLFVPVVAPEVRALRLTPDDTGVAGERAIVGTTSEWMYDLRVLVGPHMVDGHSYVLLADEAAWFDLSSHGIPVPDEATRLVPTDMVWLV